METERELATNPNEAICRYSIVHPPEKVLAVDTDALHLLIRAVVVRYRELHQQADYLDVVTYAQHEKDAVRDKTSTSQVDRIARPLQKSQPAAILQTRGEHSSSLTTFFQAPTTTLKAQNLRNLFHHGCSSLEFESSQKPSTSDKTDLTLALGHQTVSVPRIPCADLRAQSICSGWVSTERPRG